MGRRKSRRSPRCYMRSWSMCVAMARAVEFQGDSLRFENLETVVRRHSEGRWSLSLPSCELLDHSRS